MNLVPPREPPKPPAPKSKPIDWGSMSERDKMVWSAGYAAAITSCVFEVDVAMAVRRANEAVTLLRDYAPEGSPYRGR